MEKYYDQVELNHYPKTVILNFLNIVLNNNYFEYKNTYFKQTNGCAMGSICSPTYAILVLAYCEDQIFEECKSIFNETETEIIIISFYRYIYDILILWPFNETKLNEGRGRIYCTTRFDKRLSFSSKNKME